MFYKVIDEIAGELEIYRSLFEAELEAERRLNMHRNGYETKKKSYPPIKAILIQTNERTFTICVNYDITEEEN